MGYKTAKWGEEKIDPKNNNFGFGNDNPDMPIPQGRLYEGSPFSNFMNKIPVVNPAATFHDNLGQQFFSQGAWMRWGSPATYMPAGIVTFGALAAQYPGISWSIYFDWRRR